MSQSRTFTRLFASAALAMLLCQPAAAQSPAVASTALAPDPAVKFGTLPNGLRYAIMRNATPAKGVAVRLAIDVGSYYESENERGIAHFIEHMAFRSTRTAPDGVLSNRFAAMGVAIGRDQNASTSLNETLYKVDMPAYREADLRTILEWMRSAADGILFTDAAVNVERGVVLAEKDSTSSPIAIVQEESIRFQAPELRSSARLPIGTAETLRAATPATLKSFYERWYRPDNAVLVIVGDAPAADLERLAAEAFGSWAAKGERPAPPAAPALRAARGLDAWSRSGATLPSVLSACRWQPPEPKVEDVIARRRMEIGSRVWTDIVNRRMTYLANSGKGSVLGAGAMVSRDMKDAKAACLMVMPTNDDWEAGLRSAQAELRRFGEGGPTPREVEESVEGLRSAIRAAVAQRDTRNSAHVADQLVEAQLKGEVFEAPEAAMRSFDRAVAGFTPATVKAAFEADWRGTGPLLIATGPKAPQKAQLIAAWSANSKAAPLTAYADRATATWVYEDFGKAGQVVKREAFTNPEFVRLHFGNGTILNYKYTTLESGRTDVRVRFGHGQKDLERRLIVPTMIGAGLLPVGGLGRMDFEEISSALANSTWNFNLDIEPLGFEFRSQPLTSQVERQAQLFAAFMTDPGFRPTIDDKLPTAVDLVYRSYRSDPKGVAAEALGRNLYPDAPDLPPRDELAALRAADLQRILKPLLTTSPAELTIVGDISEVQAAEAVARSFGALPRRGPVEARGKMVFRRFPTKLPATIRATHEGGPDKAAAVLTWPLYVATPERRSEEYAIELVGTILDTRLRERIRGELGKSYWSTVASEMPDQADQGILQTLIESTPGDIDALVGIARQTAADLAAGKLSQQDLDTAREPLIAARLQAQNSNAAWAGVISHSYRHPETLDELVGYERMLRALSLDQVRKAASTWLARAPVVSIAVPEAAAKAGTSSAR